MTVNRSSTHSSSPVAHLYHDHRERKDIRFFVVCSGCSQGLRRCPSHRLIVEEGPLESWVSEYLCETEIRDPWSARVVYKDVRPLYAPMNHVVGVEVFEAASNAR